MEIMETLSVIDTTAIIFYFIVVVFIGIYSVRRQEESAGEFFLANRQLGWFAIGASLFATNISGEHFVGLAGSGAAKGLIVGHFEWIAIIVLLIVGWSIAPHYLKEKIFTTPEFLGRRFGASSKIFLSTYSIFIYIVTKISITLFAGGILLHALLGWNLYTSAVIMVVATGIYTVIGGLRAIITTHIFQTFLMLFATFILTVIGLNEIGGFGALTANLPADYFTIFRPASDPEFPWTGIVFGAPIIALWYWGADQYMVQRLLGARNIDQAKKGTLFAAILKIFPVFFLIIPGMIAAVMYPEIRGDEAFPRLLSGSLLPTGVKGLVIASIFAALMSSLASSFHSAATLFTRDVYMHFHPHTNEQKQVLIGRLAAVFFVLTAVLWIPLTRFMSNQMYLYMQNLQAFLSPPIVAVFFAAIFIRRTTGSASIWTLVFGSAIGLLRMVSVILPEIVDAFPLAVQWILTMNFLHFAVFLFVFSLCLIMLISLLSEQVETSTIVEETSNPRDATASVLYKREVAGGVQEKI